MVAQPIECLAAIAWEASKPLDVTTVIVDPPKKGEVRIRVRLLWFCLRHWFICWEARRTACQRDLKQALEHAMCSAAQIVATALCHTDAYTLDGKGVLVCPPAHC